MPLTKPAPAETVLPAMEFIINSTPETEATPPNKPTQLNVGLVEAPTYIALDALRPHDGILVVSQATTTVYFDVDHIDKRAIFGQLSILHLPASSTGERVELNSSQPQDAYLGWGSFLGIGRPLAFNLERDPFRSPVLSLAMEAVAHLLRIRPAS